MFTITKKCLMLSVPPHRMLMWFWNSSKVFSKASQDHVWNTSAHWHDRDPYTGEELPAWGRRDELDLIYWGMIHQLQCKTMQMFSTWPRQRHNATIWHTHSLTLFLLPVHLGIVGADSLKSEVVTTQHWLLQKVALVGYDITDECGLCIWQCWCDCGRFVDPLLPIKNYFLLLTCNDVMFLLFKKLK